MDELSGRLVTDRSAAVGAILNAREGPADKIKLVPARLPNAEAPMQKAASDGRGMGGAIGAGLSIGQVQGDARQFITYARGRVGEDVLGEIAGAIPGLSQFV